VLGQLNIGNAVSVFTIFTTAKELFTPGLPASKINAKKVQLAKSTLELVNNFDPTGITGMIGAFIHEGCPNEDAPPH